MKPRNYAPPRGLILSPCRDCEAQEHKAKARGRPDATLATCALHTALRAEPEPMVGFRPGLVRRLGGVSR